MSGFLAFEGLRKVYADGTEAVKGIDLDCVEGEFVVLLGPSGCGKTTTLRMLAGLEVPTAGRVRLDGEDVTRRPPGQRDVGFVFQFYALYPHMNVWQNIAFPLQSLGLKGQQLDQEVGGTVERLGLGGLVGRYPGQLSGGDQQRVALARAMVRRPRLYLMDEPLGTLDAELRQQMRELIRAQQLASGVTTVYVTHDQEEAMNLADRIVVMRDGRIRQAAPPGEVYERPADLFTAHFIGSPGMNFIDGAWDAAGRFVGGDGALVLEGAGHKAGKAVLGIRPEYVRLDTAGGMQGRVVLDEYAGPWRNLHVETACGKVIARIGEEAQGAVVGAGVRLVLDPEGLNFFEPESGRRYP